MRLQGINLCWTGCHLCSSVFSEAGEGGPWLLFKCLLSVLAGSLSSGAPLQNIKRCPQTKPLCELFHDHWDRLLMRVQSLSSDLTFGLLSRVSARIAEKRETVCSHFCNSSRAERETLCWLVGWLVVHICKETNCTSAEFDFSLWQSKNISD